MAPPPRPGIPRPPLPRVALPPSVSALNLRFTSLLGRLYGPIRPSYPLFLGFRSLRPLLGA
ncbi:hypothetical protein RchiOBHm_Chr5g0032081 [Rosa chinensis]|uniref:Uncharacterized protein n=1 Tax=Rosa chinensis TaxID=74649 RepID=A0A2P6QAB9_ROSCH|nr:hypothetical protein RchiOBHm_Chr5g0032081 [Rosa chinensis]